MKDYKEYSKVYELGNKTILVYKSDCHYSVLLEDDKCYTEVIVSSKAMDAAMKFPAADETTWLGQFRLLFGNYDGFEYFIKFCQDNYVATKTYVWPK